jgi:DNA-binding transcriptional LysR family regulator
MFLDPALSALRRTHPEVKAKLLDLSPGEQIVALRKGEIDLALIGQEGALLSSEFYVRKLAALAVVTVMPADHSLASRERIPLKCPAYPLQVLQCALHRRRLRKPCAGCEKRAAALNRWMRFTR